MTPREAAAEIAILRNALAESLRVLTNTDSYLRDLHGVSPSDRIRRSIDRARDVIGDALRPSDAAAEIQRLAASRDAAVRAALAQLLTDEALTAACIAEDLAICPDPECCPKSDPDEWDRTVMRAAIEAAIRTIIPGGPA